MSSYKGCLKETGLKETSKAKIKALIAHLYLRGLYGVNQHDIELLFSAGVGPNVFGVTMYQQRMKFILPHITFDDREQRQEHWSFLKCSTKTTQSTSFRQYGPNKRRRYGFLLKSLFGSRFIYTQGITLRGKTRTR